MAKEHLDLKTSTQSLAVAAKAAADAAQSAALQASRQATQVRSSCVLCTG